jgi:hypothetical protein
VQVWVNGDERANVSSIANFLDKSVNAHRDSELKAFVIYLTPAASAERAAETLTTIAAEQEANSIGMAYLPIDHAAARQYKINMEPEVKNTVFVYRNKRVVAKFVNLKADEEGLAKLSESLKAATEAQ